MFLPIGAALVFLLLGLVPEALLRTLGDALARDGSATLLFHERTLAVQRRLVICGGVFLIPGVVFAALALRTSWSPRTVRLADLGRELLTFFRRERAHAWMLAGFTVLNASLAVSRLAKPITCDESYTTLYFASRSPLAILCNYISPNNHLLHSLLAHASMRLFGDELWALRLPALLAGVACVPVSYLAVRPHLGRLAALLSACAIATWPYLIDVQTNARGYPLVHLCFLLLLALAPRLLHTDTRRGWVAFALLCAVGFWSVPVMVYPFAAVVLWLWWMSLRVLGPAERRGFLLRLALSSTGALILASALYLPSIVVHGEGVAFAREFMRPRLPSSGGRLWQRIGGESDWTAAVWSYGASSLALPLLALSAAAGLFLGRRPRRSDARLMALAALGGTALVVLASSRVPPGRCLGFLLLTLLILAAFGLASVLERASPSRGRALAGVSALALAAVATIGVSGTLRHRHDPWRSPWYDGYADAEEAAHFLAAIMTPRDRVIGIREERPPLHYYYRRLTGRSFYAFYPFDPEVRASIRVNPDMNADDAPSDVDAVYLVDTYKGGLEHLIEALERSGFRRSPAVKLLSHSRLVRFENVDAARLTTSDGD